MPYVIGVFAEMVDRYGSGLIVAVEFGTQATVGITTVVRGSVAMTTNVLRQACLALVARKLRNYRSPISLDRELQLRALIKLRKMRPFMRLALMEA